MKLCPVSALRQTVSQISDRSVTDLGQLHVAAPVLVENKGKYILNVCEGMFDPKDLKRTRPLALWLLFIFYFFFPPPPGPHPM